MHSSRLAARQLTDVRRLATRYHGPDRFLNRAGRKFEAELGSLQNELEEVKRAHASVEQHPSHWTANCGSLPESLSQSRQGDELMTPRIEEKRPVKICGIAKAADAVELRKASHAFHARVQI